WKFHALSVFMTEKSIYHKPHFGLILNNHVELSERIVQNLSRVESLKLLRLIPACFQKLKQQLCFVVQSKFGTNSFEGYRALASILQEVSFNDTGSIDKAFLNQWPQWLKKGIKENKNLEELLILEESKEKSALISESKNFCKNLEQDWIIDVKESDPIVSPHSSINRLNEEFLKIDLTHSSKHKFP
ncbi:MAG TPA: hypothetical protein VFP93_05265, partial [Gammaproteobacteria bacterium]|nr:hypothetical protein [Gammaproteobacteria bacterium]